MLNKKASDYHYADDNQIYISESPRVWCHRVPEYVQYASLTCTVQKKKMATNGEDAFTYQYPSLVAQVVAEGAVPAHRPEPGDTHVCHHHH